MQLPKYLLEHYYSIQDEIRKRLIDFKNVNEDDIFYELCFCLCTPQSKAINAEQVQIKLKEADFRFAECNPVYILSNRKHYIRFHNQKSMRLLEMKTKYIELEKILKSELSNYEKRNILSEKLKGLGLKESSHFLRNIGYENLAILDRHILKELVECKVIEKFPSTLNKKQYLYIEQQFLKFSEHLQIPVDELDLLFWSYKTGFIFK